MGISRQTLYYQPKLPEKDLKLKAKIEKVMSENKAYGHTKRILRIMKILKLFEAGLQTLDKTVHLVPPLTPKLWIIQKMVFAKNICGW